jgi:selenocysteine-specific elongation factor
MIVATAGHIDHGKTLLVKALTGVDADRLPEEKRRGMTIDLGFAYLPDPVRTIGFVDVPGHERFIHNMLCGVAGIDCALLVVAADDGPMPQTREHLAILDLLGVRLGLVALTKIDRVASGRLAAARVEIEALLAGSTLAGAPVLPVSAVTGEGVAAVAQALHRISANLPRRAAEGNFRLAVDRAFTVAGAGLVVTGTVFSGSVKVGDEVRFLLAASDARVRAIHAQNAPAETGRAGERCALNLAGTALHSRQIERGEWVVAGNLPPPVAKVDARVRVLAGGPQPVRHWTPVHVHLAAAERMGRVAVLGGNPVEPGRDALVQLVLAREIGAVHGDRLILRDSSARRTIGGGRVIDVYPPRRGRAKPDRLAVLHALETPDPAKALESCLELSAREGAAGVDLARFGAGRNLSEAEAQRLFARVAMRRIEADGTRVGFHATHWAALRGRALDNTAVWHRRFPDSPGVPEERLLEGAGQPAVVAQALAAELTDETALVREGAHLRSASHRPAFGADDDALWQRIAAELQAAEARPPTIAELAAQVGTAPNAALDVLVRAARNGLAVRVSETRFFLPRTVDRLAAIAERVAASSPAGRFSAAQFRDVSGLGRNLSIDVLAYFDRIRYTRRVGDLRIVLKRTAQAAERQEVGPR